MRISGIRVTYLLDGAGRTVLLEPGKDQKADGVLFRVEWRELHARSR